MKLPQVSMAFSSTVRSENANKKSQERKEKLRGGMFSVTISNMSYQFAFLSPAHVRNPKAGLSADGGDFQEKSTHGLVSGQNQGTT